MSAKYSGNYVCFPCKKVARTGKPEKPVKGGVEPSLRCPGCGGAMVRPPIAGEPPRPSDAKAWNAFERRVVDEISFVNEYNRRTYASTCSSPCAPVAVRSQ